MRLYLLNPGNSLVSLTNVAQSRWNRYRIWKPLGLLTLAALTPGEWDVCVFDENLGIPDYRTLPRPDLVGITAFTSQAARAYELADTFRGQGIPVVMGGIHATMCQEEALDHVDSVVAGEAESVWATVLEDCRLGRLRRRYRGEHVDMAEVPAARRDLLAGRYVFGSIQTTRGCPLRCGFCSVSSFNGALYRQRPIGQVIQELTGIREKWVLVVDDNLIGTGPAHIERAKDLFRAMIRADLRKRWIGQVTINFADDDELLSLAARAGCQGVFIGFESPSEEGLAEVGASKARLSSGRDIRASVERIRRHNLLIVGSFILGLDADVPGIGRRVADAASQYGLDMLNALFLTPLPGTRLWDQMNQSERIAAASFPDDWRYYTLGYPTARYKHFTTAQLVAEMIQCERLFYSTGRILRRLCNNVLRWRRPVLSLVANLSYRKNVHMTHANYRRLGLDIEARPSVPALTDREAVMPGIE